jgi:hypothetical protein
MCEPTTITAVTLAVVSAATAAYAANQNKHAVEDQLKEQQKQTNQAASAQMEDRVKAAREARAAARAAAAESGVAGNSVDAQLNDIVFQASRDVSRIEKNRENGYNEAGVGAAARIGEINGQLTASLISTGASAFGAIGSNKSNSADLSKENQANTRAAISRDIAGYKRDLSRGG